jgi:dihydroneopterin aldolase
MPHKSFLEVRGARLAVKLGCTAEERRLPQEVDLDFTIRFREPPPGCRTDRLEDTVCYAQLVERARAHVETREFLLMERLAEDLHGLLGRGLPSSAALEIRVTKVHPPVPRILGGVSFTYGGGE